MDVCFWGSPPSFHPKWWWWWLKSLSSFSLSSFLQDLHLIRKEKTHHKTCISLLLFCPFFFSSFSPSHLYLTHEKMITPSKGRRREGNCLCVMTMWWCKRENEMLVSLPFIWWQSWGGKNDHRCTSYDERERWEWEEKKRKDDIERVKISLSLCILILSCPFTHIPLFCLFFLLSPRRQEWWWRWWWSLLLTILLWVAFFDVHPLPF